MRGSAGSPKNSRRTSPSCRRVTRGCQPVQQKSLRSQAQAPVTTANRATIPRRLTIASSIRDQDQRLLAVELGVNWRDYDREVSSKRPSGDVALTANKVVCRPWC